VTPLRSRCSVRRLTPRPPPWVPVPLGRRRWQSEQCPGWLRRRRLRAHRQDDLHPHAGRQRRRQPGRPAQLHHARAVRLVASGPAGARQFGQPDRRDATWTPRCSTPPRKTRQVVSVRFHGLVREEHQRGAEPFDEVWHLVKPLDTAASGPSPGSEQTSPPCIGLRIAIGQRRRNTSVRLFAGIAHAPRASIQPEQPVRLCAARRREPCAGPSAGRAARRSASKAWHCRQRRGLPVHEDTARRAASQPPPRSQVPCRAVPSAPRRWPRARCAACWRSTPRPPRPGTPRPRTVAEHVQVQRRGDAGKARAAHVDDREHGRLRVGGWRSGAPIRGGRSLPPSPPSGSTRRASSGRSPR
jgi:hypothetical protein